MASAKVGYRDIGGLEEFNSVVAGSALEGTASYGRNSPTRSSNRDPCGLRALVLESGGRGVGAGIKHRLLDAGAAGPESGGGYLMAIGLPRNSTPRMLAGASAVMAVKC